MSDIHERISSLAQRIRAGMQAGATLDAELHRLRPEEANVVPLVAAVRELGNMSLSTAKMLVSNVCEGKTYAHLTLADIELLGDTPRVGVDFFIARDRDDAIIDRKPWLLYARHTERSVYVRASAVPLAAYPRDAEHHGSISGSGVSWQSVTDKARAAAAAWPTEIAIERDDPDEMLLRFLRARTG